LFREKILYNIKSLKVEKKGRIIQKLLLKIEIEEFTSFNGFFSFK
jgi:hypothetical protein